MAIKLITVTVKTWIGGRVGILTSSNLTTTDVTSHTTKTFLAMWVKVHQDKCTPLVVGCIYHPPDADNIETTDYITTTLIKLAKKHPTVSFIVAGDFNRPPLETMMGQNNLRNLVNFPTRNEATLDMLLTDIPEYKTLTKLAPIANNDHCCILLDGVPAASTSRYRRVIKRKVTEQSKVNIYITIAQETWDTVIDPSNVHEKDEALH